MVITVNGVEFRTYDHLYAVSEDGQFLRNLVLTLPVKRKDGYLTVGRQRLAHRVVATCWVPNPEGCKEVHHINGNKADNRASNLEWVDTLKHKSEYHRKPPYKMTDEHKAKLRAAKLGTRQSEETKQKKREIALRNGNKPPVRSPDYKMSPESILKCRENNANNRACMVDGIVYPSFGEAGRALGVKSLTLRKRCLSPNFSNYRVLE